MPTDTVIELMCQKFGVNETWIRTGAGEPFIKKSRKEEMTTLFASLLNDRPESFRSRLVTALLKFDPDGQEWEVLERIYDSVAAKNEESER